MHNGSQGIVRLAGAGSLSWEFSGPTSDTFSLLRTKRGLRTAGPSLSQGPTSLRASCAEVQNVTLVTTTVTTTTTVVSAVAGAVHSSTTTSTKSVAAKLEDGVVVQRLEQEQGQQQLQE